MTEYKPKPTRYHKGNYRSRTEARWAVCWDTVGLPYIYEHEDTYLPALQKRYLPDFYANTIDGPAYIEIKGKKSSDLEIEKCYALSEDLRCHVILIEGSPWHNDYQCTVFYPDYDLLQCQVCGKLLDWYEPYCEDCRGNWQLIQHYEPSQTVGIAKGTFGEVPFSYSSLITLNVDKKLPLIKGSSLSLSFSKVYQGWSSLHFAFRCARHARFEYIQNQVHRLYQGERLAFPPSFQSQDWSHTDLLYYGFCCEVKWEVCNILVEWGFGPLDLQENYEVILGAIELNGEEYILEILDNLRRIVFGSLLDWCDYYEERDLGKVIYGIRNVLDERQQGLNEEISNSLKYPGWRESVIRLLVFFILIAAGYNRLQSLYPNIHFDNWIGFPSS